MRACLIIDNPQRDLDGLVLVARHLACSGGKAYLVPMYTQGFDVNAIMPDVVLTNYVRSNNADLLKLYRSRGIAVVVLDSEGQMGRSVADRTRVVSHLGCADYVDAYCFWGERQRDAFVTSMAVPESIARLTGCPRYDFCAPRWRAALPYMGVDGGYILVATNFIVVNPRYSLSSAAEVAVMKAAGSDSAWAERYAADAKVAYVGLIDAVRQLAARFPMQRFVIRPHPFEAPGSYDAFRDLKNCEVRGDGPSLAWLNGATLLLHLNSSMAIEAAMLGVEAVSLEWLNTDALSVPAPGAVSHLATSYQGLERLIADFIGGKLLIPDEGLRERRAAVIRDQYLCNDGASAARVAAVLAEVAKGKHRTTVKRVSRSARSRLVDVSRRLLGYQGIERLRRALGDRTIEMRRAAKYFTSQQVAAVLRRLDPVAGDDIQVRARAVGVADLVDTRLASGRAICVCRDE